MNDYLKIFIDGACQPNPGNGGIGVFIDSEEINEEISISCNSIKSGNVRIII